ncbi:HesB/YadR/YfhF family protein [Lentilactobacillus otakiensis]|uniref:HesB/YadR/YfhF family protein n=1 Tax=Lentilactobacillus otakiensis DSM 19908 = JCM 15040 TaxID=1423780 RepID=S4NNT8_9LACO|nr:hesB/YadR/YfhF family protein [Lentilactobacillus otakiensis]KRL09281.1 HesB YadR YfhF family protein [Lentilactobacillus otakiensis DSM 19908 = JCM 15040]MBZ3776664.1 iron-sulfur cluster biosynthesis protein [Lentilactobacillus otakiensis]MDV3519117.1 iron-sulfur cluster biosynthesis protein [Lentilactobacillus otakiensis]GAD15713.1 hesB/YadR/YfhF family protein [Lentilactobacillus otakiensis DSM 19908 = JCM 15040]
MKIEVTDAASKWFQSEMGLSNGNGVRFYGKVYGKTPVHEGFSLALTRDDTPGETYTKTEKDGITYFVDEGDRWFFVGFDLTVDFNPEKDPENVVYTYTPNGDLDK